MPQATVTTTYEKADIERTVYFPDQEYFIIEDRVSTNTLWGRTYELLIHGNGISEDSTFALTEDGGEWVVGDVLFTCSVSSSATLTFGEEIHTHSFYYGQILTHSCLVAGARGKTVEFTTVLLPTPITGDIDSARPVIELEDGLLVVARGDEVDYFRTEGETLTRCRF